MNKNLYYIFDDISQMAIESCELIELLCGYYENSITEFSNAYVMLTAIEIIKKKQENLIDRIDEVSTNFYNYLYKSEKLNNNAI